MIFPIVPRLFYSSDELSLLHPRHKKSNNYSESFNNPRKTSLIRRWSFESSSLHPPSCHSTLNVALGEDEIKLQRQKRYAVEDLKHFFPLAARCANPLCRKLTIYRCQRCNKSFSCSIKCQREVCKMADTLLKMVRLLICVCTRFGIQDTVMFVKIFLSLLFFTFRMDQSQL